MTIISAILAVIGAIAYFGLIFWAISESEKNPGGGSLTTPPASSSSVSTQ